jgi:hypothetical protein
MTQISEPAIFIAPDMIIVLLPNAILSNKSQYNELKRIKNTILINDRCNVPGKIIIYIKRRRIEMKYEHIRNNPPVINNFFDLDAARATSRINTFLSPNPPMTAPIAAKV